MPLSNVKAVILCAFVVVVVVVEVHVQRKFWKFDTTEHDVYYAWVEGRRILHGENPYERILSGDMLTNRKYATYFPLFYELSFLTQAAGLRDYPDWINSWRYVFLQFYNGIGILLFYVFCRRQRFLIAIFASSFWLFNRWTLHVSQIAHIDFIPLFFLLLSLLLFHKRRWASYLLFGLSLALKQIAIFALPLYLIWAWQSSHKKSLTPVLAAAFGIMIIPVLVSLPFIIWNAEGFFKSILFSATRYAAAESDVVSIDAFMGLKGLLARVPMLCVMAVVYVSVIRCRIGMYMGLMFAMFVFLAFNSALFHQYMCWVVPFISLCVCDVIDSGKGADRLCPAKSAEAPMP